MLNDFLIFSIREIALNFRHRASTMHIHVDICIVQCTHFVFRISSLASFWMLNAWHSMPHIHNIFFRMFTWNVLENCRPFSVFITFLCFICWCWWCWWRWWWQCWCCWCCCLCCIWTFQYDFVSYCIPLFVYITMRTSLLKTSSWDLRDLNSSVEWEIFFLTYSLPFSALCCSEILINDSVKVALVIFSSRERQREREVEKKKKRSTNETQQFEPSTNLKSPNNFG